MGTLRIGGASGFWGDRNDALADQVRAGPVDVVMLDYLAEVTMSILRRKLLADPSAGYAGDFLKALAPVLGEVVAKGIRVVTNAGGMNPRACAEAVVGLARKQGLGGVGVGLVTGDDVFDRLDALASSGVDLANLDTGAPLSSVRERVLSANAYLGSDPIAEALRQGAQIVVTGRCTDSALVLGPLLAHFGWRADDWNRRAAGVVAGHVIECGGQASGGNFCGGWQSVPDLANLGYPLVEVEEDGSFVVTKHASLGGAVTAPIVKEQLLYEILDPRAYETPDVVADFTTIQLRDDGQDRVHVSGIRGRAAPERLKVSVTYEDGWMNVVSLGFSWPDAVERARATEAILLARCRKLGIRIDEHLTELLGVNAAHGPMAPPGPAQPAEVMLRVAIRTRDRESARRFSAEISPLVLSGVPGAFRGLTGARQDPIPIVNHWPALVPRTAVAPEVQVLRS